MATGEYTNMYLLDVSESGKTTVETSVATTVDVTPTDGGNVLFGGEAFTVSSAPGQDGSYTYVGEVLSGGMSVGFAAFNQYGQEVMFTNSNYIPGDVVSVDNGDATTICFMAGTAITVPDGARAVESLEIGDLVCTADGAVQPVKWIGRQTVARAFADPLRVNPIRIRAGALGDNLPVRDLLVSPDHALLVGETLVHASALVNDISIVREQEIAPTFTYYHVELADHSLILAEGVPAETFIDNVERLGFDNWAEHEKLYPNAAPIAAMDHPRAKSHRQVPYTVRKLLAERCVLLAGPVRQAA